MIIFLVLTIFLTTFISAAENSTTTTKSDAEKCINGSQTIIDQLANDGFNTIRIQDIIKSSKEILDAQKVRENKNQSTDYSKIIASCQSIEQIKFLAYSAKDEIFVLNKEYDNFKNKSISYGLNTSEVDILMKILNQSMSDERYESVIQQIPIINQKIIETEASATTVNLYYNTVSRGLKQIILDNLTSIIVIFVLLIAFLIFYKAYLRRKILERRIKGLEIEKKIIQDMIKRIQREYFEEGKMPEGEYNVKTKKFAELIRDIERRIPMLKEEIAMMNSYFRSDKTDFEKKIYKRNKQ